jgi:molybdate transport system substrate-binding protein
VNEAFRRSLSLALLSLAPSGPAPADEILLAGAVSLRAPLERIAERYQAQHPDVRVQLTFGASSFLAAQIRAGAPVHVFASADDRIIDALAADGLVAGEPQPLARNRLVVVTAPGAPPLTTGAQALLEPAFRRIAVPDGAVPVGRYAREWLAARGLLERLEPRLVRTEHARATLAAVDLGNADAAVVYASDAALARSARVGLDIPDEQQPRILYAAACIVDAPPDARAFLRFLAGDEASSALAQAGFSRP